MLRKMSMRVGKIRAAGKPLTHRISMFNMYVAPLFQYKARFASIPPPLPPFRPRWPNPQQIPRAGSRTIPFIVLIEAKSAGFLVELRDITSMGFAAKFATIARSEVAVWVWNPFEVSQRDDEASLYLARAWHAHASFLLCAAPGILRLPFDCRALARSVSRDIDRHTRQPEGTLRGAGHP